jgi:hypothetical protein
MDPRPTVNGQVYLHTTLLKVWGQHAALFLVLDGFTGKVQDRTGITAVIGVIVDNTGNYVYGVLDCCFKETGGV